MENKAGLTYTFDESRIRAKIRNKLGQFERANQAVLRANQASVAYIGQKARENLEEEIRRDGDPRNTPSLLVILTDPEASTANVDGFSYLVHARVEKISRRVASYYRVIEGFPGAGPIGTNYWVDRSATRPIYLAFLGYPTRPDKRAAANRQAALGGAAARVFATGGKKTIIRRPVPAYHYTDRAVKTFLTSHQYNKYVYAELRGIGITIDASVRPARQR